VVSTGVLGCLGGEICKGATSEVQHRSWYTATEVVKQCSGVVYYAYVHSKYRKQRKMFWIAVVGGNRCAFIKSVLG